MLASLHQYPTQLHLKPMYNPLVALSANVDVHRLIFALEGVLNLVRGIAQAALSLAHVLVRLLLRTLAGSKELVL
jgi:hypothetical protein